MPRSPSAPPSITRIHHADDMVGRLSELDAIVEAVCDAPSVVVVQGEAGVGKSRLVHEMAAHRALRTKPVLSGYCHPTGHAFPLGPLVEALRLLRDRPPMRPPSPVTGALRELLPELDERLPPEPPPVQDAHERRHRRLRAVRELLDAVGAAVLVLEDVHWVDAGTLDALEVLLSDMPQQLRVVATVRPEDLPGDSAIHDLLSRRAARMGLTRIELTPLDEHGVAQLCHAILGREDVPAEFVAQLTDRTGGLPLAVEEVLALLGEADGPLEGWEDVVAGPVPPVLRDAVVQRVRRLPPAAQELVEALSVLQEGSVAELCDMAGLGDEACRDAVRAALASGLVREDDSGGLYLRHALARDTVHDALSLAWRHQLHRRSAAVLATRSPVPHGRLAAHAREVADEEAYVRHAAAAAEACIEAGDDAGAVAHLLPAVQATRDPVERARSAITLGRAAMHALQHERAIEVLERLADDPCLPEVVAGELDLVLSWLYSQAGHAPTAGRLQQRAVVRLNERPDLQAMALSGLVIIHGVAASQDERLSWADRACAAAAEVGDPDLIAHVEADRANLLLVYGHPDGLDRARELERRSRGARDRTRIRNWLNLGNALSVLGHYDLAREFADQGVATSQRHGYGRNLPPLQTLQLRMRWAQGEWDGLLEEAQRLSLVRNGDVDHPVDPAYFEADLVLGRMLSARGDHLTALHHLDPVTAAAGRAAEMEVLASAAAGQAWAHIGLGQAEAAAAAVRTVAELFHRDGSWLRAPDLVIAAMDVLARPAAASRQADDLLAAFCQALASASAPSAQAAAQYGRARMAEHDAKLATAAGLFAEAAARWAAVGRVEERARSREAEGRCRLLLGQDAGEAALREAWRLYDKLGASWHVNRVRATLRQHGCRAHQRTGRRGYGQDLSPREREVVDLLVAGRSDRQIAEALFIAPRTASNHVARVLRKLAVHSRDEVAQALETSAG